MSKVTISARVKIDEEDYNRILEFADKGEGNAELKDLGKLMENIIQFNLKGILGQIAQAEAQEKAKVEPKVTLFGPDGSPLLSTGEVSDT